MSSSKYALLEGYDFKSLECYETEDSPEDKEKLLYNESLEEQKSEAIDVSSVKANDAFQKFVETEEQQYQQKLNKINFIKKKNRNSVDVYQSVNENETTAQQLRRLIKEVDSLKYRIEKEKKVSNQKDADGDETMQINDINEKNLNASTLPQEPPSQEPSQSQSKSKSQSQPTPSTLLNQVSKIQNELEKMTLGIVDDTITTPAATTAITETQTAQPNQSELNTLENSLIQQKMLNQIKECKMSALNSINDTEEDKKDLMVIDENQNLKTVDDQINNNKEEDSKCITYQLFYSPKTIKQQHLSKITDLEDRITQIENILGVNDITDDTILFPSNNRTSMLVYAKGNIVTAIDSLDQQLQLLTQPKSFGNTTMKINDTIKELEQFINLQKAKMEGEEKIEELLQMKGKIDSLYTKLESTEEYSAIVTPLLTRLKTLQTLHTEASQFSESVQMFSERQEAMQTSIKNLQEMIQGLSESLIENKTIVENNVESISSRMDQLIERIDKL